MHKKWIAAALAVACSGSLWAAPMPVVASFSILGDVTRQVGGERVSVQSLVGADQDAHVYQLTSADIRKIREAKLVLVNGLGFEKAELERAARQSKVPVAVATQGIKPLAAAEHGHDHAHHGHDHSHGEHDPHVWHDPLLMQTYAKNVADALSKADPAGKAYYQQRLQAYQAELGQLHRWAEAAFKPIPAAQRKVITGHDSFAYLGKRYQVQLISAQGVSTETEPSARQIAAIIRQIKQQGVKAVFAENIKDSRMVDRIARETGVKVQGRLYSDALSKTAPANSYTGMFRHNVGAITQAIRP